MYATPFEIEITSICAGTPVCQEVLLGAAAGVLVYEGVQAGVQIYQARKAANQRQNEQFKEAVRQIEQRCGRALTPDEQQRLHRAISKQAFGLGTIVEIGVGMYCPGR